MGNKISSIKNMYKKHFLIPFFFRLLHLVKFFQDWYALLADKGLIYTCRVLV